MNIKSYIAAAAASVVLAGPAAALNIDFEGVLAPGQNVASLGNTTSIGGGITVSSVGPEMRVVRVGKPTNAFVPNDEVTPAGAFGTAFLSTDLWSPVIDVTMDFAKAVSDLSFYIADIDGDEKGEPASNHEVFTITGYKGGMAVTSTVISAMDVAGDGVATLVDLAGYTLDSVSIMGTTSGGQRLIGWGLDNIQASAIPLPAGAVLMLSALGGMAAMRRRKSATA